MQVRAKRRLRCPDQPDPRPDPNPDPNPTLWGAGGLLSRSAGAVLSLRASPKTLHVRAIERLVRDTARTQTVLLGGSYCCCNLTCCCSFCCHAGGFLATADANRALVERMAKKKNLRSSEYSLWEFPGVVQDTGDSGTREPGQEPLFLASSKNRNSLRS